MRTNGLVLPLVIALAIVNSSPAAEENSDSDSAPASDKAIASEHLGASSDAAAGPAMCSQDLDTRIFPEGWHDWSIGSTCAYHLYAGTEFTFFKVHSQTGGRTTLSFSDT